MVDEAGVDIEVSKMTFQWHWVTWTGLFLAVLDLVVAALLLREDRWIADDYMFAAQYRVRYRKNEKYRKAFIDRDRRMHDKLRKTLIGAIAAAFIFTGLYASVALYGMTLQSFSAVDALFLTLLLASSFTNFVISFLSCAIIMQPTFDLDLYLM